MRGGAWPCEKGGRVRVKLKDWWKVRSMIHTTGYVERERERESDMHNWINGKVDGLDKLFVN